MVRKVQTTTRNNTQHNNNTSQHNNNNTTTTQQQHNNNTTTTTTTTQQHTTTTQQKQHNNNTQQIRMAKVLRGTSVSGARPSPGRRGAKVWDPRVRGPKTGGPDGWGAQNFALFFPSSAPNFLGLLVELSPRFKAMTQPIVAFGLLKGHFVQAPAAPTSFSFFSSFVGFAAQPWR